VSARWQVFVGLAIVLAVSAFQLWISADNPPGFFRDEAALAYNAHTIAEDGRDEYGARFPLYFSSFLDYKSPIFVYGLAGVFRVTGPDREVARAFAAFCMLAAILLLGWLAFRRTESAVVGVATVVLGGCSPWLFELGRIAFEVAMEPLFLCLALLGVERASRTDRWHPVTALPVSFALGAITYVYAGGRLLAPLLAGALVVVGRRRWKWVAAAWLGFAVTQAPLLLYSRAHPGALSRRYEATTFITDDMPPWEVAWRASANYLQDLQVWHYVFSGDVKPYAHTPGAGALLGVSLVLSLLGAALVLLRYRSDPFWRFALAALAVSLVPAAVTIDRFHAVRLAPFAVMLVVVAIPAVEALATAAARARRARFLAIGLVALASVQFGHFVYNYTTKGPLRTGRFEAAIPSLLGRAWANDGTMYVDYDDREPLTLARWHALDQGIDQSRVVRLPDGGVPPTGTVAFGRTQECDYVCTRFQESGDYWIARVEGPRS
jgi:4-amino-4-deoxy-L-arabinose transferase-like glycosyltransferase